MKTKWYRPLTEEEDYLMQLASTKGYSLLLYRLTVTSDEIISQGQFYSAFLHLFRQCQNLRLCLKEQNGQKWFVDMGEAHIDVEFSDMKDVTPHDHKEFFEHRFDNSTGPLWKVWILNPKEEEKNNIIYFLINHSITDGGSQIMIFTRLRNLLHSVLIDEDIDDTDQLGSIMFNDEFDEILKVEMQHLSENEELKEKCTMDYEQALISDPILSSYYSEYDPNGCSYSYTGALSELETSSLVNKCKDLGIKVNSALAAALNIAHMLELQTSGIERDIYPLTTIYYVDFRRHMKPGKRWLGLLRGSYLYTQRVSADENNHFWEYAKRLEDDLRPKLTGKDALRQLAVKTILNETPDITKIRTPHYICHFSNYTKVDFATVKSNSKVEITKFDGFEWLTGSSQAIAFTTYTFQGKLGCCLDFTTEFVDVGRSLRVLKSFFETLKNVT